MLNKVSTHVTHHLLEESRLLLRSVIQFAIHQNMFKALKMTMKQSEITQPYTFVEEAQSFKEGLFVVNNKQS